MRLTCDRKDLNDGLGGVAAAAASKSPLPILGNILLEAAGDRLRLAATDLEMRIERRVPAQVTEPGAITLPARLLTELAGVLPDAAITLAAGAGEAATQATITCGRSHYQIPLLSSVDFPVEQEVGSDGSLVLPQGELATMLRQVLFAVSKDDTRPVLTAVLLEVIGARGRLVATDTHRLALREFAGSAGEDEERVLIPGRALTELRGLLAAGSGEPVRVQWDQNQIQFATDLFTLVSRRQSGPFPNYEKIMPTTFDRSLTIEREAFLQAVRRVEIVGREDSGRVRLRLTGSDLEISAKGQPGGHAREALEVEYHGDEIEIAFGARYLLDALGALDGEQVVMEMTEPLRPAVLRPLGREGQLILLMPMSIV